MDSTSILTKGEIAAVLSDLKRGRRLRYPNVRRNLTIFRLSCCCGLRASEICGLDIGDVVTLAGERPCVRVRKEITKGREGQRRSRNVPLWWDSGTLEDLTSWLRFRMQMAEAVLVSDPFVCSLAGAATGRRLLRQQVASMWQTAIRVLGTERVRQLSIHKGRHSFCSHALQAGLSLVAVRDAAGHANVSMTSRYLHVVQDEGPIDIFGAKE